MRIKWSDLTRETQDRIIKEANDGADTEELARKHNIKHSSMTRTIRRINQKNKISNEGIARSLQQETTTDKKDIGDIGLTTIGDMTPGSNPGERTTYVSVDKPINVLMYTDAHFPFQDEDAVNAFYRACQVLPHDILINGGDTLDMYGLSKYGKDPNLYFAKHLEVERTAFVSFAKTINEISPNSIKLNLFGNHMYRYMLWLYDNPSVMWVEDMQVDKLMRLDELGWQPNVGDIFFNANLEDFDYPDPELMIHHGTLARKHAGSTSRGESEKLGYVSTISGHIHRLSVAYKRTISRQILMAEGGTLRTLDPEYMKRPDWQHGFLYFTFVPGIGTFCSPILIINGVAYYNGNTI